MKIKLTREELNYYSECIKYCTIKDSIGLLESDQIKTILEYDDKLLVEMYLNEGPVGGMLKMSGKPLKALMKIIPKNFFPKLGTWKRTQAKLLKWHIKTKMAHSEDKIKQTTEAIKKIKSKISKAKKDIDVHEKLLKDKVNQHTKEMRKSMPYPGEKRQARSAIKKNLKQVQDQISKERQNIFAYEKEIKKIEIHNKRLVNIYNTSLKRMQTVEKFVRAQYLKLATWLGIEGTIAVKVAKQVKENKTKPKPINLNDSVEEITKIIENNKEYRKSAKQYFTAIRETIVKQFSSEKVVDRIASIAILSALMFAIYSVFVIGSDLIIKTAFPMIKKLFNSLKSAMQGKKKDAKKEAKVAKSTIKKLVAAK